MQHSIGIIQSPVAGDRLTPLILSRRPPDMQWTHRVNRLIDRRKSLRRQRSLTVIMSNSTPNRTGPDARFLTPVTGFSPTSTSTFDPSVDFAELPGDSAGPSELRIDPPHRPEPRRRPDSRSTSENGRPVGTAAEDANAEDNGVSDDSTGELAWFHRQTADLVDHLQAWSEDLDAREAQLNGRASSQDQRERQFRLQQSDAANELAEQQRAIERIRAEIQAQARRIAFQN